MVLLMSNQKFHHIINKRITARNFAQPANQHKAAQLWLVAASIAYLAFAVLNNAGMAS